MSDLQCAATLLIARHAEAEYESPILADAGGSLTMRGRRQAEELAERLAPARVAAIYSSDMSRAVQTAEIVAARLGVTVRVRSALREFVIGMFAGRPASRQVFDEMLDLAVGADLDVGIPGGETRREIVARMRDVLEQIIDLHRGETVLVVGHSGATRCAVPHVCGNVGNDFGRNRPLGHAETVRIAADADGWRLESWGEETVGRPVNRGA